MDIEVRKLHIIRELLSVTNEKVIREVENVFRKGRKKPEDEVESILDLVGVMTEEDAEEMKKVIAEGCENINDEDWK